MRTTERLRRRMKSWQNKREGEERRAKNRWKQKKYVVDDKGEMKKRRCQKVALKGSVIKKDCEKVSQSERVRGIS